MTETKVPESTDNVEKKILRQMEHYFGDYNLPRDTFLLEKTKENDGWVAIETMLKFHRLKSLCENESTIFKAISSSNLLEVDEENKKIRRIPSKVVPEYNEERKKELQDMTVYVKGFDKEMKDIQILIDFFDSLDGILNVNMRMWTDKKNKDSEKNFKGSVFVTFTTKEYAKKFMDIESFKYKDEELIRLWQADYFTKKADEISEKRKSKMDNKQKAKDVRVAASKEEESAKEAEKKKEENNLPKGAVLVISGLNDITTREDIKERLKTEYAITIEDIAYIYYQKGEKVAKLRFKTENGAVDVLDKIKKAEGPLKINDVEAEAVVLAGDEETDFLKQCIDDIYERKNKVRGSGHKRRGGFSKDNRRGRKRARN